MDQLCCKRRARNARRGYSLVELMITVAIGGALLAVGVPGYRYWIASYHQLSHAQYLAEMLNLARSEAIKRGDRVNLCKTQDRLQCADDGGWENGWILFVDANRSGAIDRSDSEEPVLRVDGPAPDGITVRGNRPVEDYVSYTGWGHARMLNGALQMGTFVVCRQGMDEIHVILANSGRARIEKTNLRCG
jgi:type IV fimbrial biogenesis protein FimT